MEVHPTALDLQVVIVKDSQQGPTQTRMVVEYIPGMSITFYSNIF